MSTHPRSESGVILILVAFSLLVLIGLGAFAVDLGDAWYARAQAQTAADAGALAGAISLAKDDTTWTSTAPHIPAGGIVEQAAETTANQNLIRGTAGAAIADGECPAWKTAPNNTNCVRVRVYRDGTNGSTPFNTLFAAILGVPTHGVKATATAQILAANQIGCVRPYFIPDGWVDTNGNEVPDAGEYTEESRYKVPDDIGAEVMFHDRQGPGAFGQLAIGGNGTSDINYALLHCAPSPASLRVGVDAPTTPGLKGGQKKGLDDLMDIDPDAELDADFQVINSCADTQSCVCPGGPCPYGGMASPRIFMAPLCNPLECYGVKNGTIEPIGILVFFVTDVKAKGSDIEIYATLIKAGADLVSGDGITAGDPTSSFGYFLALVQ